MRTILFIFSFTSLVLGICKAQQPITLTPQSASGWAITGADPQTLETQPYLILPAEAQITRTFVTDRLDLRLITQAFFVEAPDNWPVLEIGPVALIMARVGSIGKLFLIVDEQAPVELPLTIALDEDGRSRAALTVDFILDPAAVTVTMAEGRRTFPITTPVSPAVEVVVSAGADRPWVIDQLAVTLPDGTTVTPITGSLIGAGQTDAVAAKSEGLVASAPAARLLRGDQPNLVAEGRTAAPANLAAEGKPGMSLQIFTPASVRHGRFVKVRTAVAKGQFR